MKRLITISHEALEQREFQKNVVDGMLQLASAVHRKRDEDENIDEDFPLKQESDWFRLNDKYKDKLEFSKLVCCCC